MDNHNTIKERIQSKERDLDEFKHELDQDLSKIKEYLDVNQWVDKGKAWINGPGKPYRTALLIAGGLAVGITLLGLGGGNSRKQVSLRSIKNDIKEAGGKVVVVRQSRETNFLAELVRISMQTFVLHLVRKLLLDYLHRDENAPAAAPQQQPA